MISEPWRTDPRGQKAVEFLSNLTLQGSFTGQKWVLEPWQEEWVRELYGRRNPDGTRQITKVSLWMPRGLGKTQQAAGICTYQLFCGPEGQEIYAASADRDKAGRIYKAMAQSIRADPYLSRLCVLSDYHLRAAIPSRNSVFKALAADQDQGHSLAPSTLVCDELHLWRSRDLYDALVSGFGKRKKGERLEIQISTAGKSREGLAWELFSYAKNVRDGVIKDPSMLVRIFGAPDDADWKDPKVWRAAMNDCSFVDWDFIASEFKLAESIKSQEFKCRQLYLNQWVEHSAETWIEPEAWRACQQTYSAEDLFGATAVAAIDLSSVRDLTSLSLFFPESKRVLSWSWLPREGISEREARDGVTYRVWHQAGHLHWTTGNRIVHQEVAEKVNEILQQFNITQLVADPYSLHLIAGYLNQEIVKYPQSPGYMSPPSKWFETAVASKTIHHNGDPLLSWAVGNTCVKTDAYENTSPNKGLSRKRIDPCVALIMAIGAWLGSEAPADDFYAHRDNFIFDMTAADN